MTTIKRDKKVLKMFWDFVREREAIRVKRESGMEAPWTKDPVLRDYHFTNVYRAYDKGTQWIVNYVKENIDTLKKPTPWDYFFATFVYRGLNRLRTFEKYGLPKPKPAEVTRWLETLDGALARGEAIGSNRHLTFFSVYRGRAIPALMENLGEAKELAQAVFEVNDGIEAIKVMNEWRDMVLRVGPFYGTQVVADLAEFRCGTNFNLDVVVPVANGSLAGLSLINGNEKIETIKWFTRKLTEGELESFMELKANQPVEKKLTFIDLEHALCEFYKYALLRAGRAAPKASRRK